MLLKLRNTVTQTLSRGAAGDERQEPTFLCEIRWHPMNFPNFYSTKRTRNNIQVCQYIIYNLPINKIR